LLVTEQTLMECREAPKLEAWAAHMMDALGAKELTRNDTEKHHLSLVR
jgi:hypothetical protein